jgi:hypothetical protein
MFAAVGWVCPFVVLWHIWLHLQKGSAASGWVVMVNYHHVLDDPGQANMRAGCGGSVAKVFVQERCGLGFCHHGA